MTYVAGDHGHVIVHNAIDVTQAEVVASAAAAAASAAAIAAAVAADSASWVGAATAASASAVSAASAASAAVASSAAASASAVSAASAAALVGAPADAAVAAIVGSPTSATSVSLSATYVSVLLVTKYGAKGDGATDDTAAIQAALNAALPGSTVLVPTSAHHYLFTSLTIPARVTLAGQGYQDVVYPYGDARYLTTPVGSVLRCTATSGIAVLFDGAPWVDNGWGARDLGIVGPGTGTSVGIQVGNLTTQHTQDFFSNVTVANFFGGWQLYGAEVSIFIGARSHGNRTGIITDNAFNNNVLVATEVQYSDTDAIVVNSSTGNLWLGIDLQQVPGTAALRHVSGDINEYRGVYYESITAPTDVISLAAGGGNVFETWWLSGSGQRISLTGGGANKLSNFKNGGGALNVVVDSPGAAILENIENIVLTGGMVAYCRIFEGPNGNQLVYDTRIRAGARYYFENVGTASYLGRNVATGDTEIGTGSGVISFPNITTGTAAPAAGGAGALPATPKGYMSVLIAGAAAKIPFY